MNDAQLRLLKKSVAASVAAALLLTAPGIPCYQALAQTVNVGVGAEGVPGGQAGVGVIEALPIDGSLANPAVSPVTLGGSLTPLNTLFIQQSKNASGTGIVNTAGVLSTVGPIVPAAAPGTSPRLLLGTIRPAVATPAANPHVVSQAATMKELTAKPDFVSMPSDRIAEMPVDGAKSVGGRFMDRILRIGTRAATESGPVVSPIVEGSSRQNGLARSGALHMEQDGLGPGGVPPAAFDPGGNGGGGQNGGNPNGNAPRNAGSKVWGFIKSAVTIGASAAAVVGLQAAAVALLPAVFGIIPAAAVWAVASGVLILPVAFYSRLVLGARDSARLKGPKILADAALGAAIGGVLLALPGLLTGAALGSSATLLAFSAALGYVSQKAAVWAGGTGRVIDAGLTWLALGAVPSIVAVAGAGALGLGPILAMMAIPALTTIAFFLKRIISAAESGQPFGVPGGIQQLRFPVYTWVMTGVVFALLTGFAPVWTNAAFFGWMFLGNSKWFNYAFLGALAWAALSGFAAPVTFLVIAFAPERAAVWTEKILAKLLPRGAPAPSTAAPVRYTPDEDRPQRWPQFHYWLKTGLLLAMLAGLGVVIVSPVIGFVGIGALLGNTAVAAVFSLIPFFFARQIIKLMMKAQPTDEEHDPEIFAVMRDLRERINADLARRGKSPIPMPEIVNVPMPVPNAFATGSSPNKALVGVTVEMKRMVLDPENLRTGLARMLNGVEPASKSFKLFRKAIAGSIPGIAADAGPQAVILAVNGAERAQLKALGARMLRGVLGHEFSHVMHRDMLLGAVAGTMSSGIAFASYGVLWAVGHARVLMRKVFEWATGRRPAPSADDGAPRSSAAPAGDGHGGGGGGCAPRRSIPPPRPWRSRERSDS